MRQFANRKGWGLSSIGRKEAFSFSLAWKKTKAKPQREQNQSKERRFVNDTKNTTRTPIVLYPLPVPCYRRCILHHLRSSFCFVRECVVPVTFSFSPNSRVLAVLPFISFCFVLLPVKENRRGLERMPLAREREHTFVAKNFLLWHFRGWNGFWFHKMRRVSQNSLAVLEWKIIESKVMTGLLKNLFASKRTHSSWNMFFNFDFFIEQFYWSLFLTKSESKDIRY